MKENVNLSLMPSLIITFQNIRPLPKEGPRQEKRRNTRKRSSAIYTDSPEKDALMKHKLDNKEKSRINKKRKEIEQKSKTTRKGKSKENSNKGKTSFG